MVKLIFGEEPYCVNYETKKMTRDMDDLNISEYDGLTDEAVTCCELYPMTGRKKVVIIRMQRLAGSDALLHYMENPAPSTDLLLLPAEVDRRSTLYKQLTKTGSVLECKKVNESVLRNLIMKLVAQRGSSIEPETVSRFIGRIGYLTDPGVTLYHVNTAVKQLCFAADMITVPDVEALVIPSALAKGWELTTHLLRRDGKKLFSTAEFLLAQKDSPIGLLSAMLRAFRLAFKASLYAGKNQRDIEKMTGVSYFKFRDALRYTPQQITGSMDLLQGGVNRIKSGVAGAEIIFLITLGEVLESLGGAEKQPNFKTPGRVERRSV